ncbi:hypothetical protein [Haloplanus halophilus]|uniref:hypothetical protein n=1 Tax=Haloplanus halophilus TaxID=2949993 RepID=UPI00203B9194|nr:hypothetical protein [Haloplanus sp. GDY1]
MYRRALLSTGVAVATTGCLGPTLGLGSDCPRGTELRLRPTTADDTAAGASDPVDTLSPPERDAIAAAIGGDRPTMWVPESSSAPFSGSASVADDGTYYAVEAPVVSTTRRTGYGAELDAGPDVDTGGRAVAFEDLRDVDRLALFALLGYPNDRVMRRFAAGRAISVGGTLAYPDDGTQARSELVPEPAYDVIRIRGHDFRFRLVETRDAAIETRRIAVDPVATSADEFAARIYDRRGIVLDGDLPPEQRDIVEAAVEDGYDECAPYSEPYADLQRTLGRPVTRVTDDGDGVATTPTGEMPERVDYANYENEWYFVQLSEYVV